MLELPWESIRKYSNNYLPRKLEVPDKALLPYVLLKSALQNNLGINTCIKMGKITCTWNVDDYDSEILSEEKPLETENI